MNGTPEIEPQVFVPAPFPTWPPPSGGAPVTAWEMGPVTNPFPYGSTQGANINTAPPSPAHPYPSTFFPKGMPAGANGQNQNQQLPAWPHAKFNVLPDKANPLNSMISPLPLMGPGPQVAGMWEDGPNQTSPSFRTFPAGSYIDGLGVLVNPTVVRTIGGM